MGDQVVKGTTRNVLKAFGGALAALVFWSAVTALLLWRSPGFVDDPEQGRIYRPGLYVHGTEGFSWSRMNSLGMRSPEVAQKAPGEQRILFLGDSFTEALQVDSDKAYPARVADELSLSGATVTSVNAGRSGASPANYIHLAPWYAERIHPDVVVVQVSGQDFRKDVENAQRNFYVRRTGQSFETVFNAEFRSTNPFVQRLPALEPVLEIPLVQLMSQNVWKALAANQPKTPFVGAQKKSVRANGSSNQPKVVDAALLDWSIEALAEAYPRLVVVYVPHTDFMTGSGNPAEIRDALANACAQHNVRLVDTMGPLEDSFHGARIAPSGFANSTPGKGHLNAQGHAIVAAAVAPAVAEELGR